MALRWIFTADSGPFRKGLNQMRTETKSFSRSVSRSMAGVFGSAAIVAGFKSWLTNMDALAKRAKKLGAAVEDLQRVEFVAEKNNISATQLTNLLVRLERRMGDAARGSEVMAKRFRDLGLDMSKLSASRPDEAILELSKAWKKAEAGGLAYSDFLGLLDSEARELIPLLKEGPEALAEGMAKAAVVSAKTLAGVEKFNDALTDIKNKAMVGFGFVFNLFRALAVQVGEAAAFMALTFGNFFKMWADGWKAAGEILNGALTLNLKKIKSGVEAMTNVVGDGLSRMVRDAKSAGVEIAGAYKGIFADIGKETESAAGKLGKSAFKIAGKFKEEVKSATGGGFQEAQDISNAARRSGTAIAGGISPKTAEDSAENILGRFIKAEGGVKRGLGGVSSGSLEGLDAIKQDESKGGQQGIPVTSLRSIGGNVGGPGGASKGLVIAEMQLATLRTIAENTGKGPEGVTQTATPVG